MSLVRSGAVLLLALAAAAAFTGRVWAADGSKRLALVIGNAAYESVPRLTNPANDATDIAQKLKSLGFEVLLATDAGRDKMIALLEDFRSRVTQEHVALFFFAGHGITVNNESFLIPIDAPAEIELDDKGDPRAEGVNRRLVRMTSVLSPLEASKIGIVFLDACRTSAAQPEVAQRVVSFKANNRAVPILRGTASTEIKPSPYSAGVFRAYATQLDNVASDGTGRNSPFTKALLKHIGTKGISIQELMIRVRKSVMDETARKQVPWEEAALNESFYFVPPLTSGVPPAGSTSSSPAAPSRTAAPAARAPVARNNNGPARSNLPPNLGVGVGAGL